MNFIIQLWITNSKGIKYCEYHTIQANSKDEAESIGDRMATLILETEHFMGKKYSKCYSVLIGAIE